MFQKVFIGCDHTGETLKNQIIRILEQKNIQVHEVLMKEDYVDVAKSVATSVSGAESSFGVLICGSGVGVSIVANKTQGIRAALCHSPEIAKLSRIHNDANILCLGTRVIPDEIQIQILESFCEATFEGGRHAQRVQKIE